MFISYFEPCYKLDKMYEPLFAYEIQRLLDLGVKLNIIYFNENGIEIIIKCTIHTLVNLNKYVMDSVSFDTPRLCLTYYSSPDFYRFSRPYPSVIFDLFEYLVNSIKISALHKNTL